MFIDFNMQQIEVTYLCKMFQLYLTMLEKGNYKMYCFLKRKEYVSIDPDM